MLQKSEANPISSVHPSCLSSSLTLICVLEQHCALVAARHHAQSSNPDGLLGPQRRPARRRKGKEIGGSDGGSCTAKVALHCLANTAHCPVALCQTRAHPALRARWQSERSAVAPLLLLLSLLFVSLETVCTSERRHTECENFADDAMRLLQLSLNTQREWRGDIGR